MKGMQESILKLAAIPQFIADGNRKLNAKLGQLSSAGKKFTIEEIELLKSNTESIVKGDSKYLSIAAASVLAKTYRDEYMNRIHEE
jgi:ribonuclease HII